jgi:hypothetical protein
MSTSTLNATLCGEVESTSDRLALHQEFGSVSWTFSGPKALFQSMDLNLSRSLQAN